MLGIIALIIIFLIIRRIFFPKSKKLFGGFFQGAKGLFSGILSVLWQITIAIFRFLFFVVPRLIYWLVCVLLEFLLLVGKSLKLLWNIMISPR